MQEVVGTCVGAVCDCESQAGVCPRAGNWSPVCSGPMSEAISRERDKRRRRVRIGGARQKPLRQRTRMLAGVERAVAFVVNTGGTGDECPDPHRLRHGEPN